MSKITKHHKTIHHQSQSNHLNAFVLLPKKNKDSFGVLLTAPSLRGRVPSIRSRPKARVGWRPGAKIGKNNAKLRGVRSLVGVFVLLVF